MLDDIQDASTDEGTAHVPFPLHDMINELLIVVFEKGWNNTLPLVQYYRVETRPYCELQQLPEESIFARTELKDAIVRANCIAGWQKL